MIRFYDADGREIDRIAWVRLFLLPDYRIVKRSIVREMLISTCWLGMNQRADDRPPPLIFETCVFGGWLDLDVVRYATEDEARRGHARIVDLAMRYTRRPTPIEWGVEYARSVARGWAR